MCDLAAASVKTLCDEFEKMYEGAFKEKVLCLIHISFLFVFLFAYRLSYASKYFDQVTVKRVIRGYAVLSMNATIGMFEVAWILLFFV